jgi:hypothetical protein
LPRQERKYATACRQSGKFAGEQSAHDRLNPGEWLNLQCQFNQARKSHAFSTAFRPYGRRLALLRFLNDYLIDFYMYFSARAARYERW